MAIISRYYKLENDKQVWPVMSIWNNLIYNIKIKLSQDTMIQYNTFISFQAYLIWLHLAIK